MSVVVDLSGRTVLVTGGARGVGSGIVRRFLEAGADVEICGRTGPAAPVGSAATASDASDAFDVSAVTVDGRSPHFSVVDVRDPDRLQQWVDDVVARRGRIDVAVNNVGGSPFGRFEAGSPRYLRALVELNFLSAAFLARAVHPVLAAQEGAGSLINISSISAQRPSPGTAVYGAAKAALESLTASLAAEWAPRIRVNAVRCGLVATEGAVEHYGDEQQYARVASTIPRGRMATPDEIGDACVFLASPFAAHITGAVLAVDGGGEWPAFLQHTPNADVFAPDLAHDDHDDHDEGVAP
ncbi:SDR family oxidoreductase [Herbiconiux sp. P17]|uniref:SDR family oxidoreductase n=1 Tax=Herbiconiux wuyangfengii TaxID=3342794 RepID=UPI0035B6B41E